MQRPHGGPSSATVALLFVGTFLAVLMVYLAGQLLQMTNVPLGLTATSLLVFGGGAFVCTRLFNVEAAALLGLRRCSPALVILGFLLGAANMGFANSMMGALRELLPRSWSEDADAVAHLLLRADPPARLMLVVAAGLAAPVGEELFFRGWLQGLLGQWASRWSSILVVAVLFSFIHFDRVGFIPRVELAMLFGALRLVTGSLWPAVAAHAAHNIVSTAALYLADNPLAELNEPFDWQAGLMVAGGSIAVTGLLWWALTTFAPAEEEPGPRLIAADEARPVLSLRGLNVVATLAIWSAVLVGTGVVLFVLRDLLPGAELSRALRDQVLPP